MDAHKNNGTWVLIPRPTKHQDGKKHVIIRGVWKYRIKTQQGVITKYKARLCADGRFVFALAEEVFAGTPMQDIVFLVFALAAYYNVEVIAGDVPAAYVQASIPKGDTLYYLEQPLGYEDTEPPDYLCLLLKCLYGLPQSGHQWNEELANFLLEIGLH
jgi:Reverse transcriptase (RNA-dependent DNA polymerase)